jgi:hypothetical protein
MIGLLAVSLAAAPATLHVGAGPALFVPEGSAGISAIVALELEHQMASFEYKYTRFNIRLHGDGSGAGEGGPVHSFALRFDWLFSQERPSFYAGAALGYLSETDGRTLAGLAAGAQMGWLVHISPKQGRAMIEIAATVPLFGGIPEFLEESWDARAFVALVARLAF